MRANILKQKIDNGASIINGWVSLDSDYAAEVLSHSGLDSVTVDLQHGMFGIDSAVGLLRAVSSGPAVPMARCSHLCSAQIGKLLDAGAYGIICPDISTGEDARALVAACKYPPYGARSFGPARGLLYGGPDYPQYANDEILPWAMIESREALENLDEIVQVEGLYGVYIGPNDLAWDLGLENKGALDPVLTHVKEIIAKATEAGIAVGMFTRDEEDAIRAIDLGVNLVTPGNDVAYLRTAASSRIEGIRSGQVTG